MKHPMTAWNADFRVGIKAGDIIRLEADGKIQRRVFDLLWRDATYFTRIFTEAAKRAKQ